MSILAVNAGSSSLKFSLHGVRSEGVEPALFSGSLEGLEPGGRPVLRWRTAQRCVSQPLPSSEPDTFTAGLARLGELLGELPELPAVAAVAHRVVHGGPVYTACVRVTPEVLNVLAQFNSWAPLHQPHNLQGIRAFQRVFPDLPQVACFDTAYHATISDVRRAFAIPQVLSVQGLRRYGFHGLSYQYVMGVLQQRSVRAGRRVLMAHLGNGASLCAAREGRSADTTMGFSALEGLMMGTRCGALDAGVVLYLLAQGWDHDRLQDLLYRQSGLLGVSGISADMRTLQADGSAAARHAIDVFTHRIVRESGAMCASLQGLDVLAFSGGIGEHDAVLRARVCQALGWLGVGLDDAANRLAAGDRVMAIQTPTSAVEVWVVPTDEGRVAAREAAALLGLRH